VESEAGAVLIASDGGRHRLAGAPTEGITGEPAMWGITEDDRREWFRDWRNSVFFFQVFNFFIIILQITFTIY